VSQYPGGPPPNDPYYGQQPADPYAQQQQPSDPYYGQQPADPYAQQPPVDPNYGQPPGDPYAQQAQQQAYYAQAAQGGWQQPPAQPKSRGGAGAAVVGIFLVILGLLFLFGDEVDLDFWQLWPVLAVSLGVVMVIGAFIPRRRR
jgi:hypothetical protein